MALRVRSSAKVEISAGDCLSGREDSKKLWLTHGNDVFDVNVQASGMDSIAGLDDDLHVGAVVKYDFMPVQP